MPPWGLILTDSPAVADCTFHVGRPLVHDLGDLRRGAGGLCALGPDGASKPPLSWGFVVGVVVGLGREGELPQF